MRMRIIYVYYQCLNRGKNIQRHVLFFEKKFLIFQKWYVTKMIKGVILIYNIRELIETSYSFGFWNAHIIVLLPYWCFPPIHVLYIIYRDFRHYNIESALIISYNILLLRKLKPSCTNQLIFVYFIMYLF